MTFSPVFEDQADARIKGEYQKIKKALGLPYVPLFFTYIGVFPEYLSYLTDQLISNLQNPKFSNLVKDAGEQIDSLIKSSLSKSEEIEDWLSRYRNSPSFYNFQKSLEKIFSVNLRLVFIFVALREALKGWAIAAKKLPFHISSVGQSASSASTKEKDFIFENLLLLNLPRSVGKNYGAGAINDALARRQSRELERDLLKRYIFLCRQEFSQQMEKEEFVILRVGIEKLILSSLTLMPEKITSPINIFYKMTGEYPEFPELLYLMSEHFPTYAVQRLLFCGFMKNY